MSTENKIKELVVKMDKAAAKYMNDHMKTNKKMGLNVFERKVGT